jgi:hypothetical protein
MLPRPSPSSSAPPPLPTAGPHHPHRQWRRVHRPLLRRHQGQAARQALRPPSLRPALQKPRHRASPDKALRPQTNGMVERFNRRIADAIRIQPKRGTAHRLFRDRADRDAFLEGFVDHYNRTRLRCLNYRSPSQALKALDNLPGPNTKAQDPSSSITPRKNGSCGGAAGGRGPFNASRESRSLSRAPLSGRPARSPAPAPAP